MNAVAVRDLAAALAIVAVEDIPENRDQPSDHRSRPKGINAGPGARKRFLHQITSAVAVAAQRDGKGAKLRYRPKHHVAHRNGAADSRNFAAHVAFLADRGLRDFSPIEAGRMRHARDAREKIAKLVRLRLIRNARLYRIDHWSAVVGITQTADWSRQLPAPEPKVAGHGFRCTGGSSATIFRAAPFCLLRVSRTSSWTAPTAASGKPGRGLARRLVGARLSPAFGELRPASLASGAHAFTTFAASEVRLESNSRESVSQRAPIGRRTCDALAQGPARTSRSRER
jgi:hypothetical protein